jgi:hypothetical protein
MTTMLDSFWRDFRMNESSNRWFAAIMVLAVGIGVGRMLLPPQPLPRAFAITSQADETFAICTAPIDVANGIEGIFILDFATGDITGGVLNAASGMFATSYKWNVLGDLGFQPGQAKNPKFLLVAGSAELRPNPRIGRRPLAPSVIYVTDCTTGATAAYGIPWSPQQANASAPVMSELVPLDVARPRGAVAP